MQVHSSAPSGRNFHFRREKIEKGVVGGGRGGRGGEGEEWVGLPPVFRNLSGPFYCTEVYTIHYTVARNRFTFVQTVQYLYIPHHCMSCVMFLKLFFIRQLQYCTVVKAKCKNNDFSC